MKSGIRKRTAPRLRLRRREETSSEIHERAVEEPAPAVEAQPQERTRRPNGPEERERLTGGPQDKALYLCRCGSAFQATVSASVNCPHCGDSQAW